jgi:hypothetical protein
MRHATFNAESIWHEELGINRQPRRDHNDGAMSMLQQSKQRKKPQNVD